MPSHRYSEISYFCQHADAVAYIACASHAGFDYRELGQRLKAEALVAKVFIAGQAIVAGEMNGTKNCTALEDLYQAAAMPIPAPNASSVALFQLSGGTTGVPKLIPRTHDDYYYSIRASALICAPLKAERLPPRPSESSRKSRYDDCIQS